MIQDIHWICSLIDSWCKSAGNMLPSNMFAHTHNSYTESCMFCIWLDISSICRQFYNTLNHKLYMCWNSHTRCILQDNRSRFHRIAYTIYPYKVENNYTRMSGHTFRLYTRHYMFHDFCHRWSSCSPKDNCLRSDLHNTLFGTR